MIINTKSITHWFSTCNLVYQKIVIFFSSEEMNKNALEKSDTANICTVSNNYYYTLNGKIFVIAGKTKLINSNQKTKKAIC